MLSIALASTQDRVNNINPLEKHDWVLDSGCIYYMTLMKHLFITYKEIGGEMVYMGNNQAYQIVRIGSFYMKLKDEIVKLLRNF